ncbi:MAG: hypothetical protein ACP5G0_02240 [Desulfomonilia bacterium]
MDSEAEAKKVLVQLKHNLHEEALAKIISDLQYNLEHHATFDGLESIFAHVRANAAALLFLCQERKRDRDKRKHAYEKPGSELPPSGSDIL